MSYRPSWRDEILGSAGAISSLEIIADHYFDCAPEKLEELAELTERFGVVPHGLGLSLGTAAPLDEAYLQNVLELVDRVRPPWYAEHLAFTRVPGLELGCLAPLPRTWEAVDAVSRNVERWRQVCEVPLLLENIAYLVDPGGDMDEAEFLATVLSQTSCGLLLDLHNLYSNARNHRYDAVAFLERLPLERVRQVHIAGGYEEDGLWIDSHSAAPPPGMWSLLEWLAGRSRPDVVVMEWDRDLPSFTTIAAELEKAANVFSAVPA